MSTPFNNTSQRELAKRLLAGTPFIQNACALDLIIFLHRHPRTLLTSEQLAAFLGYNLKDIAKALDDFIEAGLLARMSQQSVHAARLFVLLLDGPHGSGTKALVELGSTRAGRECILQALRPHESGPNGSSSRQQLRLINAVGSEGKRHARS